MTSIFHTGLSKDFSLILNDADDFNVIIQVGENQNIKEFRAHSVILRARSSYFKGAFSTDWIVKKNNMIIFNKPNIAPSVFDMILKYIYIGELDLTNQSIENILELLIASDELLLEELLVHLEEYLIKKQPTWTQQDFTLVLYTAFKIQSCKKLQDYCLGSICENPQPFITSSSFPLLDKDILYELFKRNDLEIEEIVAWDYLIKWGIEQTPVLKSKKSKNSNGFKWSNKDYESLRKTLSSFIPLIRFVELSSADYVNKVRPYKAIIPNHIYEEVEKLYAKCILPNISTLPPRTRKIDSNIIKPKFANIIANWIDKTDFGTRYNSHYRFDLIYRSSHDGIKTASFRNKCNGKVASLVLVKVQGLDKIFGGYSSIGFSSIGDNFKVHDGYRFYYSSDNFIFSFENNEDTQNININTKISRVVNPSKAILDHDGNGFNFGRGSLSIVNQSLFVNNYSGNYENNISTGYYFAIEDIETFIVVKTVNQ